MGLTASVAKSPLTTAVTAKLAQLSVDDLLPGARLYRSVVRTCGESLFTASVLLDNTPAAWQVSY